MVVLLVKKLRHYSNIYMIYTNEFLGVLLYRITYIPNLYTSLNSVFYFLLVFNLGEYRRQVTDAYKNHGDIIFTTFDK